MSELRVNQKMAQQWAINHVSKNWFHSKWKESRSSII